MRTKKNMVIGILCIALVFMGLGYSLYSSTFNINGTATSSGSFDVKITNYVLDTTKTTAGSTDNTAAITNNYAVTEQNLSATFSEPGDYITWNITVTNRGTIGATITVNTTENANGAYKLKCTVTEGTTLAPGATTTFPCEMSFDKNHELTAQEFAQLPKGTDVTMTVSVTAVQSANYEAPEAEPFEIPDYIVNNDGVLIYSNIKTSSVTVPDSYDGKTITAIGSYAFHNNNVDGLMYFDGSNAGNDESFIMKFFPFETLDSEMVDMLEGYGAEIITYQELLSTRINPVDVDFSGGSGIMPVSFNDDETYGNLTSVDLSNMTHLQAIGNLAFSSDSEGTQLQSVTFPQNAQLTIIGESAFEYNNLQSVTLPNTLTTLGDSAFANNPITSISFPATLTEIGEAAFQENRLANTLTIPSTIEKIGRSAFSHNLITSVVFQGNNLEIIGESAFLNNRLTGNITFPSSLEEIGGYAFAGSGNSQNPTNQLTSITFQGNNLTKIGSSAFEYNLLGGALNLPDSVTHIGSSAFSSNRLETAYLGSNISVMGGSAFVLNKINKTNTLTDIYVDMTEATWNSTVVTDAVPPDSITLYSWYSDGTTVHFNQS